jgi:hypothetical protein
MLDNVQGELTNAVNHKLPIVRRCELLRLARASGDHGHGT